MLQNFSRLLWSALQSVRPTRQWITQPPQCLLTIRRTKSQIKREAWEDKLFAVNMCLSTNLPGGECIRRPESSTTVAQRACRWERPGCLPLFLQFLFRPLYLVQQQGKGINLTAQQHLFRISNLTCRFRSRLEQCVQDLYSGTTNASLPFAKF